ncbi:MAG: trehalase family glycosidase [Lentisphaeria bacterium]
MPVRAISEEPPNIGHARIRAVRQAISGAWETTVCRPGPEPVPPPAAGPHARPCHGVIPLPHPFTVPTAGPEFHLFFYWDTYFTSEGLLRDGRADLAQANADNLLYLIRLLGYMPNYTLWQDLDRSQPPMASLLVRAVYEHTRDRAWLAGARAALETEYAFWMAMRRGPHGLNHYGTHGTPEAVRRFANFLPGRLGTLPEDLGERLAFARHALAEAESGWDFTPRFDRRCAEHYAVDLNSLLYQHELNQVWFCEQLGEGGADRWRQRAEDRRQRVNALCWDEAAGFFFDHDFAHGRAAAIPAVSAYFTLWSGLASPGQAARLVAWLPELERPYGLVACAPGPRPDRRTYQWDTPNAWPPLQFAAIAGLLRYGYQAEARRLAGKYVAAVVANFETTGHLWEKYNAITGGVDVSDEYLMPPMLGWTAGTFLYACEVLASAR